MGSTFDIIHHQKKQGTHILSHKDPPEKRIGNENSHIPHPANLINLLDFFEYHEISQYRQNTTAKK